MGILAAFGVGQIKDATIPGGGTVTIPAPYKPKPNGEHADAIIAYRDYHSTLAGSYECRGMIAVGTPARIGTLGDLVVAGRGVLTTSWAFANESEGRWYGKPERWAEVPSKGPNGDELTGKLVVHTVGWRVYDDPGRLYAVNDTRGVMIAIWILNRHGGEPRARRYADRIAASFRV